MVLRKDVLQSLIDLPREERGEVALRVLESLTPTDHRSAHEWIEEMERRARLAFEAAAARGFDDVVAEIETKLE